jgi:hypothetical protein
MIVYVIDENDQDIITTSEYHLSLVETLTGNDLNYYSGGKASLTP